MKEFYVLNLDWRRMAIIAGGALVALGITLMVGMSIGRGQGERASAQQNEELSQKPALPTDPARVPADKMVIAAGPAAINEPAVPEAKAAAVQGDIPLQEDPLVQGPPRKNKTRKPVARLGDSSRESESAKPRNRTKKAKAARSEEGAELAGKVEHTKKRKAVAALDKGDGVQFTIQVAAFKRAGEATGLISKLKEEGIKARTEKTNGFYLVTVGRSKSKEKLAKALARLKELEYEAYIRKITTDSEET